MPCRVKKHDRIVPAISIQVKAVACFRFKIVQAIRRDESADFGIIIAAVQVVESGFRIVVVPAVAERVDIQDLRADLRQKVAPRIVFVQPEQVPAGIIDADDIALQILAVEILLPALSCSLYV